LYARSLELALSAKLYGILLQSAAAEHSVRFQLLDGASQNAERLIDELGLFLQAARQDAITSELQDLAVGAGLLNLPSE
jgi:F-type H+-transporting ATPase subunit gamma